MLKLKCTFDSDLKNMPLSAKAQFVKRAEEALKQGNTRFVARGENKVLFEEMKRKFEQDKNAEPAEKMMKLSSDPEEDSPQLELLDVVKTESESNEIEEVSSLKDEAHSETSESNEIEEVSSLKDEAHIETSESNAIEEVNTLNDEAHFVKAYIEWFDCKKKHKKVLMQGIQNAFREIAPLKYTFETTPIRDQISATPGVDKFFDKYDVVDYGLDGFTISLDAYSATLCQVTIDMDFKAWGKHKAATRPAKQPAPCQCNHEEAMAWNAEMTKRLEAFQAYMKSPEANRMYCMQ